LTKFDEPHHGAIQMLRGESRGNFEEEQGSISNFNLSVHAQTCSTTHISSGNRVTFSRKPENQNKEHKTTSLCYHQIVSHAPIN